MGGLARSGHDDPPARPARRLLRCAAVVAVVSFLGGCSGSSTHDLSSAPPLPLAVIGEVALPGDGSRFDYASIDSGRGLLFIAHLGASEVIEVDVHAHRVVRVIPGMNQVHGVIVVPQLHRVFATATGDNQMATIDEDTGAILSRSATGQYPDGLAYDPRRNAVWTTNETGGSETVIDAGSGVVRGTVELGGDVGNVAYDPTLDRMVVGVQGRGDLAVIDPTTLAVTARIGLPGCDGPHGVALASSVGTAFVACEDNAKLLAVDLAGRRVSGSAAVGDGPDVVVYDQGLQRLYVAAESGDVSIFDWRGQTLRMAGAAHLADGAHVVAVDAATHHSFYPVPAGSDGHPALLERAPSP